MVRTRSGASFEALCGALALLSPLALYLLTAAPAPAWLDSGEFIATGFVLGAAHPPGHPLLVTLTKLAMLLPIGPLALRSAAASALAAALASFLLYKVGLRLSREIEPEAPRWIGPLFALLSALGLALTPALWAQGTRPEVYAAQLALVLAALLALVRFAAPPRGSRDGRLLAAAGLAFGLSLSNHHFMSLLLVPGLVVLFTEDALARWRRTLRLVLAGFLPALGLGLLPYAHLWLRADAPGGVSLGTASSPAAFAWVVSARAFQRSVLEPPATAFADRAEDALMVLLGQPGPLVAILGAGGLYLLVRQRPGIGLMAAAWFLASWLGRAWLGFDPRNPDALGYLLVAVAVLALGAARLGPLLVTVVPARQTVRVGAATVAAAGLIGSGALSALEARAASDLSALRGAEVVGTEQLAGLPPRAVVVTDLFQTCFNLWALQATEAPRPDVAHLHLPFVAYPGYAQQVHRREPEFGGVLRAALSTGQLGEPELSALAQRRRVFVEPGVSSPRSLDPFLLPRAGLWEVAAEPLSSTDLELAVDPAAAAWDEIIARAGPDPDPQTSRVLLWRLYVDALLLARRGERRGASMAVERALAFSPESPELAGLGEALGDGAGPLDVTPYLPAAARPAEAQPTAPDRPNVLDF